MVTAAGAKARKAAPRSLYPRGAELDYAAKLRRRLRAAARGVRSVLVDGELEDVRFDSSASDEDRVRRAIGRVRVLYFEKYTEITDESLALEVEGQVTGYIERQTARQVQAVLGVDVLPTAGLKYQASEFTRDSVAMIRSVGEEFFQDLEADILGALQGGARWEQLSGVIAERYGVSAKRANLIARDQMGTLVSRISQAKQQAAGATKYIWRTSEDERVVGAPGNKSKPNMRHGDHHARNGKLFTWDRPPHDGHPGEAINCRCTAEPVWDDEEVDAKPADESDLVFDPVKKGFGGHGSVDKKQSTKPTPIEVEGNTWPYEHPKYELAGQTPGYVEIGNSDLLFGNRRGKASKRAFNYETSGPLYNQIGLPIEKLSMKGVTITSEGIKTVELHLARFGSDGENEAMVERLRRIAAGDLPITDYDVRFYTHELREFERYKALGFEFGEPEDDDESFQMWVNQHTATLEEYGIHEEDASLYHPEVKE